MKILGIETSCDETAAAVVENGTTVLANVIASQINLHRKTGGVVPEVAAREHVLKIIPVIDEALEQAQCSFDDIEAIAVTQGPGLLSSLIIGMSAASTLAFATGKKLIPVNHIAGHIYANWLKSPTRTIANEPLIKAENFKKNLEIVHEESIKSPYRGGRGLGMEKLEPNFNISPKNFSDESIQFPLIVLTVSGGHNELVLMREQVDFQILGETLDDAAGEAFDKVARLLGLEYPGGPAISRVALEGDPQRFPFPKSYLGEGNFDFSFSGLKTAVLQVVREEHACTGKLTKKFIADCAASFQEAVCGILSDKLLSAAQKYHVKEVHIAGGVSANRRLRAMVQEKIEDGYFYNFKNKKIAFIEKPRLRFTQDLSFCTDNAAMIASVAYFYYQKNPQQYANSNIVLADPNLELSL